MSTIKHLGEERRALGFREAMTNRWDLFAFASVVVGAIIRIVWGLVIHPPVDYLYSDIAGYVERAQRLATGLGLQRSDAFWPPGAHVLLATPMTLFGFEEYVIKDAGDPLPRY